MLAGLVGTICGTNFGGIYVTLEGLFVNGVPRGTDRGMGNLSGYDPISLGYRSLDEMGNTMQRE
jgi:hypothetical protein